MATRRLEDMSVDDVCDWLEDNGYPETTQQSFRGILVATLAS